MRQVSKSGKIVYPVIAEGKCTFCVWASKADMVKLILYPNEGEVSYDMHPDNHGYWSVEVNDLAAGTMYMYQLDNDRRYPDPASLSQPEGVHGRSGLIDLKDFAWSDASWQNIPLGEMIQYELHTGTFSKTGDFTGIRQKLDYLVDLGINTIEIMPVAQFSGSRNWGYDGVYPYAVQDSYGGAKALMELVDECHRKGLAVLLDVVYNHLGPEGNYLGAYGHYFRDTYSTPWGQSVNFDGPYSDEVRNYFIQNALMWLKYFHIDGLRLDAVHSIFDFSARHILEELSERVKEFGSGTGRPCYLIAESNLNDVRYTNAVEKGGYGLDAQWSDDFHHAMHALITGDRFGYYTDFGEPEQLAKAIKHAFVFDGQYSEFRKKSYGSSTGASSGEQFVIFNQNHDQVGNRKNGERLLSLTDFETAKVIAGTMFISPNIPLLFMGEEYGEKNPFCYFVSHLDDGLNKLVREGRQKEFIAFYGDMDQASDPSAEATFNSSILSWEFPGNKEQTAMLEFYRTLIALRKQNKVLRIPDKTKISVYQDNKLFVVERMGDDQAVLVIINLDSQSKRVRIDTGNGNNFSKALDSSDLQWNGNGRGCPDIIRNGQFINMAMKTIVIYAT